jgi:5-methylcytosine-specific restriction endonuclease McrA
MSEPHYPALVLNADFTPISVFPLSTWNFQRTLRNVMKGRITVLEEYDVTLRSPSFEYNPPSVIALKQYINRPRRIVFSRMNIFLRDAFCCQYCGGKFTTNELTFDHVVPKARGGKTEYNNIVSACVSCNTRKGSRQDMVPLTAPREPTIGQLSGHRLAKKDLHHSWLDYLYWSQALEEG